MGRRDVFDGGEERTRRPEIPPVRGYRVTRLKAVNATTTPNDAGIRREVVEETITAHMVEISPSGIVFMLLAKVGDSVVARAIRAFANYEDIEDLGAISDEPLLLQ